jgi:hypothetical protein
MDVSQVRRAQGSQIMRADVFLKLYMMLTLP